MCESYSVNGNYPGRDGCRSLISHESQRQRVSFTVRPVIQACQGKAGFPPSLFFSQYQSGSRPSYMIDSSPYTLVSDDQTNFYILSSKCSQVEKACFL